LPAIGDQDGRVRRAPNVPVLNGFRVGEELARRSRRPVFAENDANAAGLAEAWIGAGQGARHLLFVTLGTGVGGASGIVPRKAVNEIERVLGTGEDVQIAITDNQFVLQMPNFVMTARLIEGQFPNYEAVVPKNHPGRLVIGRQALAAALRRVAVMAEERNKPVKLTLAPATLRLSAASQELGEAEETLEVEYAGEELSIGFNSRYILDAISAVEKEQIVFEFKDSLSPGVIKTVEDEGYCCVIMPMRI